MKWKPYPKYKDTGIEWLEQVPAHWHKRRLSSLVTMASGSTPDKSTPEYWNGDVPWVSPKDMKTRVISDSEDHVSEAAVHEWGLKVVPSGTVLVVVRGMILAHTFPVATISRPVTINQDMKALLPGAECTAEFLATLLRGLGDQMLFYVDDAAHGTKCIRTDRWKSMEICLPDTEEQQLITKFLDREWDRIDALIVRQERLIELLQEKRQALIDRAVTKGLNPDAPMMPSGVAWLGDVPAHWEVTRLKFLVGRIEQGWSPECHAGPADEDEWGVLKAGCCNGGVFNPEDNKALPAWLNPPSDLEVRAGDVLMSRASGSLDLIGSVALVSEGCRARLLLSDKIYRLAVMDRFVNRLHLVHALSSTLVRAQIRSAVSGAVGLANNISQSDVKEIVLPVPPLQEQRLIANEMGARLTRLDSLSEASRRAVALMREHRAALITAAVTGKIDVREVPESAHA